MRQEFIEASDIKEAATKAPWAAAIVEVYGGFHAFESLDDFRTWVNQE